MNLAFIIIKLEHTVDSIISIPFTSSGQLYLNKKHFYLMARIIEN